MKKQSFDLKDRELIYSLINADPEEFWKTACEKYYLNRDLLELLLKRYNNSADKIVEILKVCEIDVSSRTDVQTVLDAAFGFASSNELIISAQRFEILVHWGMDKLYAEQYPVEISEACKEYGYINKHVASIHNGFNFIEHAQDWDTLVYYDQADILARNLQYEAMLDGGYKCINKLLELGKKNLVLHHLCSGKSLKSHKDIWGAMIREKRTDCIADYIMAHGRWDLLAEGDDWKIIQDHPYFLPYEHRLLIKIAAIKERKSESLQSLLHGLAECYSRWILSDDHSPVELIWLYNHLNTRADVPQTLIKDIKALYRKQFGVFDFQHRYRIGSSKWQGTYDELLSLWQKEG